MKAAVLERVGDDKRDLRDDVTTVEPGPDEVRIKVRASGICHSDLSAMDGTLPALVPGVIGHEGAGEVVEVGSAVRRLAPGDHVIVTFVPPCGRCGNCLRGQPNLCLTHTMAAFAAPRFLVGGAPAFGFTGLGTFAEELVIPADGAVKMDDDVPWEIAALTACGVLTGVGAVLNTAKVRPASTVAVIGCGGVGTAAIAGSALAGANPIIAVDIDAKKLATATMLGATHTVDSSAADPVAAIQELTGGFGADVVIEAVGRPETWKQAFYARDLAGTLVLVGVPTPQMRIPDLPLIDVFGRGGALKSSWYGDCLPSRDFPMLVDLYQRGKLDLDAFVSEEIPLTDIEAAFDRMHHGEVLRSVVIL